MKWRNIPLTYYGIILILLASGLSFYNIDGFAHTILGLVAGYFFRKSFDSDKNNFETY